jgi:nucleoside-diphosphate-sugar epimerase
MARSVAIVGAGQIAYEMVAAFSDDWHITLHARSAPQWLGAMPCPFVPFVRGEDEPPSADCVIDTIAFDEGDVLGYDPDRVGRLIAISSASVYRDADGRTLDEAATCGFPEFADPITEEQATAARGPDTYSTRKIRMETAARDRLGERATILRPCAIYGLWSRHPREYWFVKRLLDGRKRIPVMHPEISRFQTSNARDIAEFALEMAVGEIGGTFNIADENSPSVADIARYICEFTGRHAELVEVPANKNSTIGRTPWSVPRPFLVDGSKARTTCSRAGSTYWPNARNAVEWLVENNPEDWRAAFPQLTVYPWDLFDYAAEDAAMDAV